MLDGVYCTTGEGAPVFHQAPALTGEKLQALLDKIITRILRLLTRQGHLVEEEGVTRVPGCKSREIGRCEGHTLWKNSGAWVNCHAADDAPGGQ